MAEITITATKNGPYKVEGRVRVVSAADQDVSKEKDTIWLCRCGGSSNKPFCDSTHAKIGFTDPG